MHLKLTVSASPSHTPSTNFKKTNSTKFVDNSEFLRRPFVVRTSFGELKSLGQRSEPRQNLVRTSSEPRQKNTSAGRVFFAKPIANRNRKVCGHTKFVDISESLRRRFVVRTSFGKLKPLGQRSEPQPCQFRICFCLSGVDPRTPDPDDQGASVLLKQSARLCSKQKRRGARKGDQVSSHSSKTPSESSRKLRVDKGFGDCAEAGSKDNTRQQGLQ